MAKSGFYPEPHPKRPSYDVRIRRFRGYRGCSLLWGVGCTGAGDIGVLVVFGALEY